MIISIKSSIKITMLNFIVTILIDFSSSNTYKIVNNNVTFIFDVIDMLVVVINKTIVIMVAS